MKSLSDIMLKIRWKIALKLMHYNSTQKLGLKLISTDEAKILYKMLVNEIHESHKQYKSKIEKAITKFTNIH